MLITVTGSTGTIGSELTRLLSEAEAPVRAILRDLSKLRPLPGVVWARADLADARLLEPALAGTRVLFLLTGNAAGFGRIQIDVIRAAERLGVEHVVKLSALGASDRSKAGLGREHWDAEQALIESSLGWTILRPHSFMQNWLDDLADEVRAEGAIHSPVGEGRVPFIDARDIAEVAARVLLDPEAHAGRKYTLTGGEAVGYERVAAAISRAIRKPIEYRPISMEEARARMEARGLAPSLIDGLLALAAYQRAGGPTERVSDDVERVLGRAPRTVEEFAEDYVEAFR